MTIPLKPEADALRIGMLAGLFTRADVVTWADLAIAELDAPPSELIDLSTSEGLDGSSFSALLSAMPGAADPAFSNRILLAQVRAKLVKGADAASLVPCIQQMAELVTLSADEKALAARLGTAAAAEAVQWLAGYDLKGQSRLFE